MGALRPGKEESGTDMDMDDAVMERCICSLAGVAVPGQ